MIIIDEKRIFEIISQRKPVTVALNAPDGMLPQVQETAVNITKKFSIPAFVLADTTWGTCDLNSNGAKVLGAEILFNIGHTNKLDTFPGEQNNVMMIDLGSSGVLGTGTIDSLAAEGDSITLGWTRPGTVLTQNVVVVTWDHTWSIQSNHSMTYNLGGSTSSLTNWTAVDGGTPGW